MIGRAFSTVTVSRDLGLNGCFATNPNSILHHGGTRGRRQAVVEAAQPMGKHVSGSVHHACKSGDADSF